MLDVQGNRRLSDEEILQHIKTRAGEKFDAKQAQDDLQSLLKLEQFDAVRTRIVTEEGVRGGVDVIFEVMELPLIAKIKFEGLRYSTEEEILIELREQKAEIRANSTCRPEKINKARRIITEYLTKKRGFADAKVEVWEESLSVTSLSISFRIDEMENDDEEYYEEN